MPKYSPFFTFVHFYRNEEKKNGRYLTLDEAKAEADPIWAEMSDFHKMTFTEMAEDQTTEARKRHQLVRPRSRQPTSFREKMRAFIDVFLSKVEDVRTCPFYFFAFHRESHTRLPSEISVVEFTISRGAERFLHFLLNPEVSPGQYSFVSERMEKPITVVPIEGTKNSKANLDEVLDAIYQFCNGVVFTISTGTQEAIDCLGKLQKECPKSSREIVPLDGGELIYMLWERSDDGANAKLLDVRNSCAAQTNLEHLACSFHKAYNKTPVCSLWKPYRLAYALSQVLSKPYHMEPAEGFHKSNKIWRPSGKYFSGKGKYENWMFKSAASGWDAPSSAGGSGGSQWGQPSTGGWES